MRDQEIEQVAADDGTLFTDPMDPRIESVDERQPLPPHRVLSSASPFIVWPVDKPFSTESQTGGGGGGDTNPRNEIHTCKPEEFTSGSRP